jgi:hypothetical protein
MHDHRTGPIGPQGPSPDEIAAEAAAGITALEGMLAGEPPKSTWQQEGAVALKVGEVTREIALTLPQDSTLRGDLLDQAANWGLLARMRGQGRAIESREHGDLANSEGGVLRWEQLSSELRSVLYSQEVLTVDEVRELAADRELQAIAGIGPAGERAILEALAATDCQGDWLA